VRSTVSAFAESLLAAPGLRDALPTRAAWSRAMRSDAESVRSALATITHDPALTEATVPAVIVRLLPEGAVLCVGNSLCARDIDAFTDDHVAPLQVLHQRGASGIDGLLAGAAGARTATPDDVPVLVYLGDLSLVHDLAALNAARNARAPLVIVVVQNGGGRIFEQLPLGRRARRDAELAETFERLFVTPQTVSFEHAAAAFAVQYHRVTTREDFEHRLGEALCAPMATLIEAVVMHDGLALRDAAHATVQRALDRDTEGAA
jgi:2-succinyl-5-enolpyruvyl-6-hydroxy-3-cyclohexene-1-carboxylate synthase